jgi:hypothetical protein
MAQLSRPYQIVLAAVALLGLVWVVALRSHGPSSSQPVPTKASTAAARPAAGAASASSSSSAAAEVKAGAAPTPIYHGSAPGVEGLTRAIAKAHGAVAASQRNVQEQQHKSEEVSDEARTPVTTSSTNASSATAQKPLTVVHRTVTHTTANGTVTKTHERVVTKTRSQNVAKAHPGRSAQQVAVEVELAHGKTVMLVFWDPKSSVDREVLVQADALAGGSKGTVTVHAALANQVGLFGKITEVVHVYQTPTILIVNRQGVVSTLTGLTDVFSLQQAVSEARKAKS